MKRVRGKVVAVVGRGASLLSSGQGAEIDACYVVRVNWHLPVDERLWPHAGRRTDLVYTLRDKRHRAMRAAAHVHGAEHQKLAKGLRLELGEEGVYAPNTGTIAIVDALRSGAREVRSYGIDLHTTSVYADSGEPHDSRRMWRSRQPEWTARGKWNHDPDRDQGILAALLRTDPRFVPDATLRAILTGATLSPAGST